MKTTIIQHGLLYIIGYNFSQYSSGYRWSSNLSEAHKFEASEAVKIVKKFKKSHIGIKSIEA